MIFNEVRKNKTKTVFIIALFFILITLFIYFLSLWFFKDTYIAVIIGLSVSIISAFASYYNSDKIILKLNNARIATREEYLQVNVILEGLCIAANLPLPKLYIMDDTALNAFATGRNPKHAVICITSGLLNRLDKNELEGVIAHELAHIKNYDILLATITVVMAGFIVIISDFFVRTSFHSHRDRDNKVSGILMLISLVFIVLAPIFAQLIKLAISRNREYLADAKAVEFTRNKEGLINALRKISSDTEILEDANKSSASLFIINPLRNKNNKQHKDSLFSTHPNTLNRIERLQNIN